jgi:tetratricopeptide (TPR) repeat protein
MESDDDASSYNSFSEAQELDSHSTDLKSPTIVKSSDIANSAGSLYSAPVSDTAVLGDSGDISTKEPEYDESLPDGSSFRRRRLSVMESDELPDDKKDLEAAMAFKSEGNRHFGLGEFDTAIACYTEALRHLPRNDASDNQRAICYANRGACHLASGRLHDTVYDCDRALEFNGAYAKALARRAATLEQLGKLEEAARGMSLLCVNRSLSGIETVLFFCEISDLAHLLKLDPGNRSSREGISRLEAAIKARDEKLKTEMLDKLKGLGKTILGKFGMSLDNFKAVQDPATGSYSLSFQR